MLFYQCAYSHVVFYLAYLYSNVIKCSVIKISKKVIEYWITILSLLTKVRIEPQFFATTHKLNGLSIEVVLLAENSQYDQVTFKRH